MSTSDHHTYDAIPRDSPEISTSADSGMINDKKTGAYAMFKRRALPSSNTHEPTASNLGTPSPSERDEGSSYEPSRIAADDLTKPWPSSTGYRAGSKEIMPERIPAVSIRALRTWWWWLEVITMLISIGCIMAVVGILRHWNGKLLEDWPVGVSINTIVSILTTAGKSALLLPVSTSIGQFKWSYFSKPRKLDSLQQFDDASRGPFGAAKLLLYVRHRASWGALGAIITILALGYGPSTQQVLGLSTEDKYVSTSNATMYLANDWKSEALELKSDALSVQVSVLNGFMYKGTDITFNCPSRQCRFDELSSLGICNQCFELTSITPTCGPRVVEGVTSYYCYYLPDPSQGIVWPYATFMYNDTTPLSIGWTELNPVDTIINFSIAEVKTNITLGPNSTIIPGSVSVLGCHLQFCTKHYTHITTFDGRSDWDELPPVMLDRTSSNDTHIFLTPSDPIGSNSSANHSISLHTFEQLPVLFRNIMQGGVPEYNYVNQYLQVNDIASAFHGVAGAFSNMIRSEGNEYVQYITGEALLPQTYVKVRWAWLAVPVGVTGATLILLGQAILANRENTGKLLLKSSSLALLFHGLEGWERDELRVEEYEDSSALERKAAGMTAVFGGDGRGGEKRFLKVD